MYKTLQTLGIIQLMIPINAIKKIKYICHEHMIAFFSIKIKIIKKLLNS